MEDRVRPSRSGLFAIELLIAAGVFVFCAVVCLGLFARAEAVSRDSAVLAAAVDGAKTLSECYKAAGGDLETAAALSGAAVERGVLALETADGRLELRPLAAEGCAEAALVLVRGGEETPLWTVAALEAAP